MQYFMPTKVITGKDCVRNNKELLKELGSKVLLVTGKRAAEITGAKKDMMDTLESVGVTCILFNKIEANPSIATVMEGMELAKQEKVSCIVAIGGGSAMDAGKAIALLAPNDLDQETLFDGPYLNPSLPVVAVPTTPGTGSEVTPYAILTDDTVQNKRNLSHETSFPKIAFLDAKYLEKLPKEVLCNTVVDALSHAIEGYLSKKATPISNVLAAESMRIIGSNLTALKSIPTREILEELLYSSMLAGIVIAHTGSTALHAMGYSLTYFKSIDHGRANGLLMTEYLRFVGTEHGEKIDGVLSYLGIKDLTHLQELLDLLLVPGPVIAEEELRKYVSIAIKTKNIANTLVIPNEESLYTIFDKSLNNGKRIE